MSNNWILVVDDDAANLRMASHILSEEQMRVSCLKSGEDAIKFLQTNRPDLILLDIHMPGMDGFETLDVIKGNKTMADIPVIFLTANDDSSTESKGLEAGAMDFIKKPFVPEVLLLRVRHIIELVRLNAEYEMAKNEAIMANEAKSLFLSNMSHEIRTPINAVLGMNEMILRECTDEQILTYAENIRSSGKTLLFLINDILDMSKIESGKMEIIQVEYEPAVLIMDLWNVIFLRAQEKDLSINFSLDETLPRVLFGDDVRIKQIVTNLLTNAVKYTPQGGIEMHVAYERHEDKQISLIISVKDTGMGIKKEDMGKLFENFQRLDEQKNRNIEGTGLGMNITMSLLNLMDGEMTVESEYGKGSTFTVTIPQGIVCDEPTGDFESIRSSQEQNRALNAQSFEAPDADILVVDDNAMNLTVFKSLLKRTKMNIVTADSGKRCLELVKKEHFHIIFMDHMMPEMDGIETLHEIQKLSDFPNEDTPVIILTANALSGARESYLKEGFVDFLTKPIDGDLLEQTIVNFLPKNLIKTKEADTPDMKKETANAKIDYEGFLQYGISLENGLSRVKGNMEIYLDLMESFIKEHEKQEIMQQFITEENMKDYAVFVHGLKGNARTIGADKLADIAYEHEMKSKADEAEYVKAHWDELVAVWEETQEGCRIFYGEYRKSDEKYSMINSDDGEVLHLSQDDLDKIVALLNDFETDQAIEQLKEWISQPLTEDMHTHVKDVLIALDDEFDEAKAIDLLKKK